MAQWMGQFSGLTHETKVHDIEASLRQAAGTLAAATAADKERKAKGVLQLAERLLACRRKAIHARISALVVPETQPDGAQGVASLREREQKLQSDGVDGILDEFGVAEIISQRRPARRTGKALLASVSMALLLGAWFICRASAQSYGATPVSAAPLICVVCAQPLAGKYFVHNQTNNICADCEKLPARCSLCGLPVKDATARTTDGRLFCHADGTNVVVAQEEAGRLFAQARGELSTLSEGTLALRSPEVAVQLVDVDYWNPKSGGDSTNAMHRLGFSISRPIGGGYAHNVVLMSGRLRNTTLSTCAHEFAHLWLNENLKPDRKLDPDTREALCELFAFKLAARRGDTNEIARIKVNPYTKGVVLSAIEFDAREGLPGVVTWVRNASDASLPAATGLADATAAASAPEPMRELRPPPPPATRLELRSLLRTSKRTVAVINGERFERGSELSMLIDGKRHLVRMEEAQENAVVVSVDGVRQTLRLGTK